MRKRYIDGYRKDNWVTYIGLQEVNSPEYFIHKTYNLDNKKKFDTITYQVIKKLLIEKKTARRSNLNRNLKEVRKTGKEIKWEDTLPVFKNDNNVYASSHYIGAHPVLMYQNTLTGHWHIATGYGVINAPEVKIDESVEWTLRNSLLIGWIYFLGIGKKTQGEGSLNRLLVKNESIWKWSNVHLSIWGIESEEGLSMGGKFWQPLFDMENKLTVGTRNVIHSVSPTNKVTNLWKKWLLEQIDKGKTILWKNRGANTIYERGLKSEALTAEDYQKIMDEIVVNIRHTRYGVINYVRT